MTKIYVLGLVLFVRRHLKRCEWVYHTTLGPSDHGSKPPSSRLRTWYSHHRQWFMTKTHVFRLVILVRRQFKRCVLISTTLDPSDHGSKPPSSRLGTLYSYYKQWFMTKYHVFSLVSFVQRQFERWGLISNTPLSPNGHGKKPPSSRPGT